MPGEILVPKLLGGVVSGIDQLQEKLVKVLVVARIVAAFKAMLTLPISAGWPERRCKSRR